MTELSNEINHIQVTNIDYFLFEAEVFVINAYFGSQSNISSAKDEQSTYLAYEKRVKEAAAELTEQQSKLADYNLLVDKQNTDTEVNYFRIQISIHIKTILNLNLDQHN